MRTRKLPFCLARAAWVWGNFAARCRREEDPAWRQAREEYFADIADGHLDYYTIGIEKPVIEIDGDQASITFTSVLNASAYGAVGTYRMKGTHHYVRTEGNWIAANGE